MPPVAEHVRAHSRSPGPSFRDPLRTGGDLTMVLEQCSEFGGMERIAQVVAERWPETQVVAPRFGGEAGPTLFPRARHVDLRGSRSHVLAPLHVRRLRRAVRLDGAVVLALHSCGWALGPEVAPGVPVVALTNGSPRWMGPLLPFYIRDRAWPVRVAARATLPLQDRFQRRIRARADVVLACSEFAASTLAEPAAVLYPPVDLARFHGTGDPGGHVMAVGRLVAHKRFDVLLEAMRSRPERLVVVGTGPDHERLRSIAPANVGFVGAVDDDELVALLRGARALVHPTREEFGIVMAEALAAGVPVIAPRAGAAREIVESGQTGRLLSQVTPAAIAAALYDLVFDPAACHRSAARFGVDRFLDQLGAVLDAAAGRGVAAPARA
jgi:glycosyltransferase involved in cell wall biosynthesis